MAIEFQNEKVGKYRVEKISVTEGPSAGADNGGSASPPPVLRRKSLQIPTTVFNYIGRIYL